MLTKTTLPLLFLLLPPFALLAGQPRGAGGPVTWKFDNLKKIGGHVVTVIGDPRVVKAPG